MTNLQIGAYAEGYAAGKAAADARVSALEAALRDVYDIADDEGCDLVIRRLEQTPLSGPATKDDDDA